MVPLSSVWAGPGRNEHLEGPPLLHARTAGSTPFRLVLHQGDVGHTLVVGPTGAGKSVLLNLLDLQFRRYERALIFRFDKGRSSMASILGMAGSFYELKADGEVASMVELYRRRRDLVCEALVDIGVDVHPPHATIYVWAPVPEGFASSAAYCEHVLEQAAVVLSPGAIYGPAGEGWFRISLTTPDERLLEAVGRLGELAR